jgi:hypothetical protein
LNKTIRSSQNRREISILNTIRINDRSETELTTVLTTIVVINNGIVGLTDAKIGALTYQKGLFLM